MHWKANPKLYPPYLRSRIRRGRGVGQGLDFVPWLKVRDVPSRGTSSIVTGVNVSRPYHLLSELEAIYFFLTERKSSTIDIQEQWPILDIDRTLELCTEFGVAHKYRGIYPEPFTIDFLITEQTSDGQKLRAASVKSVEDANDPATRQRLAIEHRWCEERGIPWALVDTSAFDKTLLSNLRFLRAWFRHNHVVDTDQAALFCDRFLATYATNVPLTELIRVAAKRAHIAEETAQDVFRYCGWVGLLSISLTHPLELELPLVLKKVVGRG